MVREQIKSSVCISVIYDTLVSEVNHARTAGPFCSAFSKTKPFDSSLLPKTNDFYEIASAEITFQGTY